ncbi:MAG: ornithine carbamoyltransferase [Patescibacteria group bacterium]|jgi:ornithine carbamoyltransferase
MKKDLISIAQLTKQEILEIISLAEKIKKNPADYSTKLKDKTLLMIFEKPSLRTRISFEVGMTQMGGHAIYYDLANSPMGKKESVSDTAKTASRYVDIIMARLFSHQQIEELAEYATVPVINALTDFSHPCQILGDFLTIKEKKGRLENLKLTYLGDSNNNVTHSLIFGSAIVGLDIAIGCPADSKYLPQESVLAKSKELDGREIKITDDPIEAIKDADVVYTDSWMSYHIPESEKEKRLAALKHYQVTAELMKSAKPDAIFMHCLPAQRGVEQTAEVIDGPQSVVFDQAENRLHIQKAIMLKLLKAS